MSVGRLAGRKILIAGASSGMGRGTAIRFAAEGAAVALVARRHDALESLADDIRRQGGQAVSLPADLTDAAAAEAVVTSAIEQLGSLDTAIITVGTNLKERALTVLDPADWTMMVQVNLNSAYHVTRAILPHFRSRGGALIVFVS